MASGYITPNTEYQQDFTHHFFAVPPQKLILTHWPQTPKQQLLRESLTLNEFQPLIPLSSKAVGLGVIPETWCEFLEIPVGTCDPVTSIKMTCKADVKFLAKLDTRRELEESSVTNKLSNRNLVFIHRVVSSNDKCNVRIRAVVPFAGEFVLNVYACKSSSNVLSENYELVLSYQIQCSTDIDDQFQIGYPIVYDMAAAAFDFSLLHWNKPMPDYYCEISSGKLDLFFNAKPDLQFSHCIVTGKTENPSNPDSIYHYNTLVAQNKCGDPSLHVLRSVFPSQGWWTVYLSATKVEDCSSLQPTVSGYTSIFMYHVYVGSGVTKQTFPYIIAPCISLNHPETVSASGSEVLDVQFCSSLALDFYSYLTFETQTGEPLESYTTVISIQQAEPHAQQHYELSVIFPTPGKWYVHVFGKDFTNPEQDYTGLFILNVEVNSALMNTLFPKVNSSIATALNIRVCDSRYITFCDDGSPFTYKFRAPRRGIHLIPSITPHNIESSNIDEAFLQRCTLLTPSVAADSNFAIYTMNAVFPAAGTWVVQLFGAPLGSNSDGDDQLVIYTQLQVSKPMPNICYPTIYPAFHNLGLSIPTELLHYNQVIDASEIKLPFSSPESVLFDTKLKQGNEVFLNQAIVHHEGSADSDAYSNIQNRILHIIFPKSGEWVFHLYASHVVKLDSSQRNTKEAVLELRIKALSFNNTAAFPQVFDAFYNMFSLKLDRERYPLISRVNSFPSKITIPFYSPPDVRFWHRSRVTENPDANPTTRMYSDPHTGLYELSVEVTERGQWIVELHAQDMDSSENRNWTAVLRHEVQGKDDTVNNGKRGDHCFDNYTRSSFTQLSETLILNSTLSKHTLPIKSSQNYNRVGKRKPDEKIAENSIYHQCTSLEFLADLLQSFTVTSTGKDFICSDHDIEIRIPPGAVDSGLHVQIEVGVLLHGPFVFPDGVKPISPILWVCTKPVIEFQKPVEIVLPHILSALNDKECKVHGVTFLKARHRTLTHETDSGLKKFKFESTDDNAKSRFSSSQGTLRTNHFCCYCIAAKKSRELYRKANYCITRVDPKPWPASHPETTIYFCVSYFLSTCIQVKSVDNNSFDNEDIVQSP